jgi:hypothetical protein
MVTLLSHRIFPTSNSIHIYIGEKNEIVERLCLSKMQTGKKNRVDSGLFIDMYVRMYGSIVFLYRRLNKRSAESGERLNGHISPSIT